MKPDMMCLCLVDRTHLYFSLGDCFSNKVMYRPNHSTDDVAVCVYRLIYPMLACDWQCVPEELPS